MPRAGEPVAFNWERARSPFTHDRDIMRFFRKDPCARASTGKSGESGLSAGQLRLDGARGPREDCDSGVDRAGAQVDAERSGAPRHILPDTERADRWNAGRSVAGVFERINRLEAAGWNAHRECLAPGVQDGEETFLKRGNNRVILLTDGAANMGNVDPYKLRETVEANRKQGIALDCFVIGWEGYNDNLLEVLARNGDGRYGFLNQPSQVVDEFEKKLLGAFQVAASDMKVQVDWNEKRVRVYRQVLNFTRSLQVKGDKGLQIVLQSDAPHGEFPAGKLWMLFLVLVALGLVRVFAPKND